MSSIVRWSFVAGRGSMVLGGGEEGNGNGRDGLDWIGLVDGLVDGWGRWDREIVGM